MDLQPISGNPHSLECDEYWRSLGDHARFLHRDDGGHGRVNGFHACGRYDDGDDARDHGRANGNNLHGGCAHDCDWSSHAHREACKCW